MRKVEVEIKLKLQFYDTFFFGGGTGTGNIQSYLLRNIQGFPYISGAALKGCIAEYAAALSQLFPTLSNWKGIFGAGGARQGAMYFENGILIDSLPYQGMQNSLLELRTGVSINPYTKAKKEDCLYTMELSGQGGSMAFQSRIYGFLDEDTYQRDVAHLVAAARLIYALGGKRSSGLGWLKAPIECQVLIGGRGQGAGLSGREPLSSSEINGWLKQWIGGKACTE